MAYVTQAQIQTEFRSIVFSTTTKVTAAKVGEIIAEHDAFIDGKVYQKYVTPITGSKSLLIIRKIALDLAVGRIESILRKGGMDEDKIDDGSRKFIHSRYVKGITELNKIVKGETILPDAERLTTTGDAEYNEDLGQYVDPGDDKDEDLW